MELSCDSKTTISNTHDDILLNVNAEEFQQKYSAVAVAEQRIRDIADSENQWKTSDLNHQMGERAIWKSLGHVQFDKLWLGGESIRHQHYLCVNSNASTYSRW